ncbi:MAG TPA: cytochrome P450, partial [Hyphomicrobiaceae bacterium]|nr:cytochrome P450 [Hyphomicrobiaceae bacterium]
MDDAIPRERGLDHTLGLLRDPYGFIPQRCRKHAADLFEARLMLRRTICMLGREAAEVFYDPERFERRGAAP